MACDEYTPCKAFWGQGRECLCLTPQGPRRAVIGLITHLEMMTQVIHDMKYDVTTHLLDMRDVLGRIEILGKSNKTKSLI